MDELLSIKGLSVAAGGVTLFSGLDLRLGTGEMVAVCGPSGSGKTSMLRAIAGLSDPAEGTVLLRGSTPDETGWPEYRRSVLFMDQRPVLLQGTVRTNLSLPFAYAVNSEREFPEEEAAALLETFGVSSARMDQEARSLSQGQQQRVCLVRAFLVRPEVLLLDEPTSALDQDAISSVETALVEETRKRGLSALVVTHDKAQAERLCDRILNLSDYGASGEGR